LARSAIAFSAQAGVPGAKDAGRRGGVSGWNTTVSPVKILR